MVHPLDACEYPGFDFAVVSSLSEPRWASVNRGVFICDECCSVHRSLGRHSSQVRHLKHTPWPPTQLQVKTPQEEEVYIPIPLCEAARLNVFSEYIMCERMKCLSKIALSINYLISITAVSNSHVLSFAWDKSVDNLCIDFVQI